MNSIININLNNTGNNPKIQISILTIAVSKLIHDKKGKITMNTQTHTAQPHSGALTQQTSSRALSSLLLAAGVASLVVLADHMLEPWADEHHWAGWVALWAVAVGSLLALRGLTRALARMTMNTLDSWSARMAQRRADERLWHMAQTDSRLMADLQSALGRDEQDGVNDLQEFGNRQAARILRDRLHYV